MLSEIALGYRLLKLIKECPGISQRELGLSLGKVNSCLKAFIDKGLVKVNNFRLCDSRYAYAYLLLPRMGKEKARITDRFFRYIEAVSLCRRELNY
jgi:hypothetical protein